MFVALKLLSGKPLGNLYRIDNFLVSFAVRVVSWLGEIATLEFRGPDKHLT